MIAHLRGVRFGYATGEFELTVEELRIANGEHVALVGPSGCGKSTLLGLMAGLLRAREGSVQVGGIDLSIAPDAHVRHLRASRLGLVHQDFQLYDALTVEENILLPFHVCPALALTAEVRQRAAALAERAGVAHLLRRSITRLSQGERQRVAVCRALSAQPRLVLADEPTASLDFKTRDRVLELLLSECRRVEASLVAATHDPALVAQLDRTITVEATAGAAHVSGAAAVRGNS